MSENIVSKAVVSITEMARMVGLSRARFYQLVKRGTFPAADQDQRTNRPCYFQEKQMQILEARRRNCGVDGKAILFYSRRRDLGSIKATSKDDKQKSKTNPYADLIDGLGALGINASVAQVEPIVKELFPQGIAGVDPGEVIRAVFLRIRRQDSSGSVG